MHHDWQHLFFIKDLHIIVLNNLSLRLRVMLHVTLINEVQSLIKCHHLFPQVVIRVIILVLLILHQLFLPCFFTHDQLDGNRVVDPRFVCVDIDRSFTLR